MRSKRWIETPTARAGTWFAEQIHMNDASIAAHFLGFSTCQRARQGHKDFKRVTDGQWTWRAEIDAMIGQIDRFTLVHRDRRRRPDSESNW